MNNTISIIVPFYNVENYIDECIASILNQSYRDIELILVDDGSIDDSTKIAVNYTRLDNRIRYIRQNNKGLAEARNVGLDVSSGAFIAFVDSDDVLPNDAYTVLYNLIQINKADIAVGLKIDIGNDLNCDYSKNVSIFSPFDALANLVDVDSSIRFEVWNKLYRREIINRTRFKTGQIYEDIYFNTTVIQNCSRIASIKYPVYYYRRFRPGNTNSHFNIRRLDVAYEYVSFACIFYVKYNNRKLGNRVVSLCLDTICSQYIDAIRLGANYNVLKRIECIYKEVYSIFRKFHTLKQVLFMLSPSLYVFIRSIRCEKF